MIGSLAQWVKSIVTAATTLDEQWDIIVSRAWSVRFIALAVVLTAADVALPLFFDVQSPSVAITSLAASLAALWSRIVAQKDVP